MKMRWGILAILVFFLIVSAFAIGAKSEKFDKIEQSVLSEAAQEGKVKVVVQLKEPSEGINNTKIHKMVESVSGKIGKNKVNHEFSSIAGFSASLSVEDIAKLQQDDNVIGVYYDRPISVDLAQSVSIINATLAWRAQSGGVNLTGKGETICIIDTGVDYTHPDLGNCTPVKFSINGTNESYSLESAHPYTNYYENTWNITKPGYTKIGVHFANISVERYFDYVYVLDGNNKTVSTYSGSLNDTWSPSIDGDTIYIRFYSDQSVSDYGFYIDRVINGTTNTTYDWTNCSKIIGGLDTYNYDPDPRDDHWHGTHVTGIAAANGTIRGVAPEARVISIKAMNSTGGGESGDIIAGIDWCVNRSRDYNISVISMSIGGGLNANYCDASDPLMAIAINAAVAKNISVIVSAGNNGNSAQISYPACIQNATPVGSVDKSDALASDTNRNSIVQLFAPGVSITSTWPGGGSNALSGTSMAAPHVAGAFAIINQYLRLNGKTKTPQQIESILNETGKIIYDSGSNLNFSRINIYDAILSTDFVSPNITLVGPVNNHSAMDSDSVIFEYNVTDNGDIASCSLILNDAISDSNASTINTSATNSISKSLSAGNYNWSINCTDASENTGNSSTRSLLINATPVAPPSGGGGGGGVSYTTYSPTDSEINNGYNKAMKKGDKVKFRKNNENHTLTIENIVGSYATITIMSNPVTIVLVSGEETKLNLSSADYYDLYIKVESVAFNKVNLTIKSTYELIEKPHPALPSDNQTSADKGRTYTIQDTPDEQVESSGNSAVKAVLIAAAIGVLAFLVVHFYRQYKKSLKHINLNKPRFWR